MNRVLTTTLATLTVAALVTPKPAFAQDERTQRIDLSYQVMFGRFAKAEEIQTWKARSDARSWSVQQYVNSHAAWFASPGGFVEVEKTIIRATEAAWGTWGYQNRPGNYQRFSEQRGKSWKTYVDLVKILTNEMDKDKAFKAKVVKDSYAKAGLSHTESDINGWVNGFGNGKCYLQIVAEHLAWKARQPGGQGTSGLSSSPSRPISEVFQIPNAGIVALGGGNIVALGGGNIVALGGNNLNSIADAVGDSITGGPERGAGGRSADPLSYPEDRRALGVSCFPQRESSVA
ncbi:hypothetical protein [Armatimonas sp.]|uniref:hypothetical protein n=1 Tax=Armatimonas sp. TaxID=1872638 RepID=UPI00375236D1